jgi:hypothetical protein
MDTYQVGSGAQQINLAVDINTLGLAASRAIVLDLSLPAPALTVGVSSNATGDIQEREIGTADSLKNMRLSILTKIDLIGDQESNRAESERLTGIYSLNSGSEGFKMFDKPEKTVAADFSSVVLFQIIDLIHEL